MDHMLSAESANDGVLEPEGNSTDSVPYSFEYGGSGHDLSTGSAAEVTDSSSPTGAAGVDNLVTISYSDPGFIAADTYADTITFTISAK